jgi:hypothetical protein
VQPADANTSFPAAASPCGSFAGAVSPVVLPGAGSVAAASGSPAPGSSLSLANTTIAVSIATKSPIETRMKSGNRLPG